jgi:hypothetical protein
MTPESNDSRFASAVPLNPIDPLAGKQVLAERLAGRNRHTDSGILNRFPFLAHGLLPGSLATLVDRSRVTVKVEGVVIIARGRHI